MSLADYDPGSTDDYNAAYATAINAVAPNTTTVISQVATPGEAWYDTLARALPMVAATYQQKQILGVQMDRAKAGLPPLDMSQYAAGVNIGLSPDTSKLILYAALGIGAMFLLSRSRA